MDVTHMIGFNGAVVTRQDEVLFEKHIPTKDISFLTESFSTSCDNIYLSTLSYSFLSLTFTFLNINAGYGFFSPNGSNFKSISIISKLIS